MAKKAPAKKTAVTTTTARAAVEAPKETPPAPVFQDVAELTILNYNSLTDNQKLELREWLHRRLNELSGDTTAIADRYSSHYKIPLEAKP